jgi:hypothetical protein
MRVALSNALQATPIDMHDMTEVRIAYSAIPPQTSPCQSDTFPISWDPYNPGYEHMTGADAPTSSLRPPVKEFGQVIA